MRITTLALLALSLGMTGCANYDYILLEPAEQPLTIPEKQWLTTQLPPLEYRLQETAYDRLALRITNPTDDAIYLVGPRSYVVDTQGQSHPLPDRVIAPHSYISLLIPPQRPSYRVRNYGWYGGYNYYPYGRPFHSYGYFADPFYGYPGYTDVEIDTGSPYYWDWPQTGQFRLNLTYSIQDNQQPPEAQNLITQQLVFSRQKR